MGQAVRKLKAPSRPVTKSDSATLKVRRQSADIKPAPPEPQNIIEPDIAREENRPDQNFVSMSQQIVGSITTRSAGQQEHPTFRDGCSSSTNLFMAQLTTTREYSRPMPADRHTTLLTGPDEDRIHSPGTLNHAHIRELFLLYQGKADDQEKPMDVESLAAKFNVDVDLLKRVLCYNSLVHFEKPVQSNTAEVTQTVLQEMKDTVPQWKGSEGLQVKKQPT
ncbi:unnamed protein product [Calypogeia fissa]